MKAQAGVPVPHKSMSIQADAKTDIDADTNPQGSVDSNIDPQKMERRRDTISSRASCMVARTLRLMAFTTERSRAASGGWLSWTLTGARNRRCHFEGKGKGTIGKVEMGR